MRKGTFAIRNVNKASEVVFFYFDSKFVLCHLNEEEKVVDNTTEVLILLFFNAQLS